MSIETLLADLIAAVRENTAALQSTGKVQVEYHVTPEAKAVSPPPTVQAVSPPPAALATPVLVYATHVKPKVLAYAAAKGRDGLMELLATFGTDSALRFAETATPERLQALHDALEAGL